MNSKVAEHQTEGYQVNTEVYEGPLDLLLELIEKAELDITTLALAQVTDQYLEHLKDIQDRDPSEVSAFLVIAARLLQIKSAALLPKPKLIDPSAEDEEDPGEALARQLLLYRRFKEISNWLTQRQDNNQQTYLKTAPAALNFEPKLDLSDITLSDLQKAAQSILAGKLDLPELSQVVNMPRVTIRQKIRSIINSLKTKSTVSFKEMLQTNNRIEVVVTFLALLELVKRHVVEANQEILFGDIEFKAIADIEETQFSDIEFDE